MDSAQQEILSILNSLENSYNPSSPLYKFSHVFYNVVDAPVERPPSFPVQLWSRYFIPGAPLLPVILNRNQMEERKKLQNELIVKINESKNGLLKKIDGLKMKRETVKMRLESVCGKFRRVSKQYVHGDVNDNVYKIQAEIYERDRYVVRSGKDDLIKYMSDMNERLVNFDKKVSESLHAVEMKGNRCFQ